ncbi:MAG: DUF6263 family protein [Melioribacteraceae bacterium]|nr:DUF6263 family protein [Melioribacteraceae bacterium]
MKKLIIAVIFIFLFYSCGSNEESKDQPSEAKTSEEQLVEGVEASVSKDREFDLSYSFEDGQTTKYRLNSSTITNQRIESGDSIVSNEVNQSSEYEFELKTLSQNNEEIKFELNINSVMVKADYNGEIVEFNSEVQNTEETLQKFPEYASFPNNKFEIIINKQGRIVDVMNVDKVVSRYLEIQKVPTISEEERQQLTGQLIDQALQPLSQQIFKYMPETTVKVDSSWTLSYPSELGMFKLQNNAVSKLNTVLDQDGKLIAKISTNLFVDITGDGEFTRGDVKYNFDKPEINGEADTYFDIERGLVTRSRSTTESRTLLLIEASNPEVGRETAQRIDHTINTNDLELIEVN